MKKIYLAGFDVFYPDAIQRGERMKAACKERNLCGLFPCDNHADNAHDIFQGNVDLIRQADIVVANLNWFRGQEMDCGTAFEIGYAYAMGKDIWGYLDDDTPMVEQLGEIDENGFSVENFGAPVNLMIAQSSHIVCGSFTDCLDAVRKHLDES
ncbi:nucleoside 2-deoxyribosyltransferase [Butyricicoccus sp.]|uniref:nucleoside 2-deoxyribosyltransferase n=1 Tax=Butyricicoccus sp. TaxID=2049021 RepID=UPI003734CFCA